MSSDTWFSTRFPHIFIEGEYGDGRTPKIVDELDILKLCSSIRDKENWETKMKDPSIVSKWKEEARGMGIVESDKKMEYVLKELEWVVSTKDAKTGIETSTVDNTYHSDSLIPEGLRQDLINCVRRLEHVPEVQKDWHPGSNGQVLDLVHPSLFPLIVGRSPVLKEEHVPGQGQGQSSSQSQSQSQSQDLYGNYINLLYFAKESEYMDPEDAKKLALSHVDKLPKYSKSDKYQWLPSDVQVDEEGKAGFLSYVNNLHPEEHPELYSCLEKIMTKFVPMFENVLASLRNPRGNRLSIDAYRWYEDFPEGDENEIDYDEWEQTRNFKPREIPDFEPPPEQKDPKVKLNGRKLQLIIKLANIHLTPDKPKYSGGVWHVEGMGNDAIIASGIYYYSNENISESKLYFRTAICEPEYEQYDDRGVRTFYNLQNEENLNQEVGYILTKEGRCIGFPNTLQHRVGPFSLKDENLPGHRKILVFFLVDPTIRVISTSRVPPQRKEWLLKEVGNTRMPDLVVDKILEKMNWPLSLEEGKEIREELMKERKYFIKESNEQYFERQFSLCEH